MKLENQVTSLELSKRLKKLGVKQESLFYWCYDYMLSGKKFKDKRCSPIYYDGLQSTISFAKKEMYSAFTVAELGEILPMNIRTYHKMEKGSGCVYQVSNYQYHHEEAKTEANARAEMLIYLLENKLI